MAPFTRLAILALLASAAFAVPVINPNGQAPAFSEANAYAPDDSTPPSPALFKRAVESGVITTCSRPGVVALTFDDGPFEYTNALLDILKNKKVKATFFLNGDNVSKIKNYKAVVNRAYNENHQIASHTWSHADLFNLTSKRQILNEMTQLDDAIKGIIGVRPTYMRPPYGNRNDFIKKILIDAGYKIVIWDADTNDWQHPDNFNKSLDVYKDVLGKKDEIKQNGHIFLQHDTHKATALELAPRAIDYALNMGFKVVTVGECLGQSKSK
ncbi:hypothetical protein KVV02_000621 [Mortierella alpina]|uniref:NodB homology domain-containing protein n=1 Tax=Mortierella alpina TaxID=64518 RepID=A0A9P8CUM0_MORAP|nr:hypothetical protein KVV02_000621 [Mortierella alpina]